MRTAFLSLALGLALTSTAFAQAQTPPPEAATKKSLPARASKTIVQLKDLPYAGSDNLRQRLDLYLPVERAVEELPVIVFIHGGAWRQGDKRTGENRLSHFVEPGNYAGVSVGYRLSQEAVWPAQIHDCKAAIRWIRAHAGQYKLDPDKIAVWGTSAGGHLAAMLGVSAGVEDLEGSLGPHTDQSSGVTCVANYFGPSALLRMDDVPGGMDHNAANSPESQLIGGPIQEHPEKTHQASPLTHVTPDDVPFLHVHGDEDPAVPYQQSVLLDAALDEADVDSVLITMTNKGHGNFDHPELGRILDKFFATHLLGAGHQLQEITLAPTPTGTRP